MKSGVALGHGRGREVQEGGEYYKVAQKSFEVDGYVIILILVVIFHGSKIHF